MTQEWKPPAEYQRSAQTASDGLGDAPGPTDLMVVPCAKSSYQLNASWPRLPRYYEGRLATLPPGIEKTEPPCHQACSGWAG
jgi:hypothetical protein